MVMPSVIYLTNPEFLAVDNIDQCRLACSRNCSCTAAAYDNQCLIWKGKAGNDWHLRVSASEKDQMIFKEKDYLDCSWTTCRVCFYHKH